MNGMKLAEYTAYMLQDQLLIQVILDDVCEESPLGVKILAAMRDAISEVSKIFPVLMKKTVTSTDGKIKRSSVSNNGTLDVKSVTADGKPVEYTVDYDGIHIGVPGTYVVTYSPEIADILVGSDLPVAPEVGLGMMMQLVARNYCMICGRMEEAAVYDSRYNDCVEQVRLKRKARIPARKFV